MEQVLQEAGSNFIFFNGAVNGIYIERGAAAEYSYLEDPDNEKNTVWDKPFTEQTEMIGRDLGSIVLALNAEKQSAKNHSAKRIMINDYK